VGVRIPPRARNALWSGWSTRSATPCTRDRVPSARPRREAQMAERSVEAREAAGSNPAPAAALRQPCSLRSPFAVRCRSVQGLIFQWSGNSVLSRGTGVRFSLGLRPYSEPDTRDATNVENQVRLLVGARKPRWRNGSRAGLKLQCPEGRVGSIPTLGTQALVVDWKPRDASDVEHRVRFLAGVLDPVRSAVRTSDFHSENTGSTPVRGTTTEHSPVVQWQHTGL
jgi:hypothetical protein